MFKKLEHVNIEITKSCNQKCFYCFNNSGKGSKCEEISTQTWLEFLKNLKKIGLKSVLFTGGEPFIFTEIIQLLNGSIKLELETNILSNGYNIPYFVKKYPNILKQLNLAQISLDSMQPSKHDARRGLTGAWKSAISAISALQSLGVTIEISSTIDNKNADDIYDLVEFSNKIKAKLILRPVLNLGRAKGLNLNEQILNRIKKESHVINKKFNNIIVKDRFNYVKDIFNSRMSKLPDNIIIFRSV